MHVVVDVTQTLTAIFTVQQQYWVVIIGMWIIGVGHFSIIGRQDNDGVSRNYETLPVPID